MNLDDFDDRNVIARVAWGENRCLGRSGMQATVNTGENRVASGRTWWGSTLRGVFVHPYQYSCLNPGDPNLSKLLAVAEDDPQFQIALELADSAIAGTLPDITGGADSYVAGSLQNLPEWAQNLNPTAIIGGTRFYRTV